MPQYYVENTHEAIIEKSEFDHVQKLMRERSIQKPWILHQSDIDFFRGRIICGVCGCKFWHQVGPKKRKDLHYWRHSTYNKSKHMCIRGSMNHNSLIKISAEVCGLAQYDETVFSEMIEKIYVLESDKLEFHLSDGRVSVRRFANTGTSDYWTPEHRKELSDARQNISYVKNKSIFTSRIKCSVCQCNFRRAKQIGKRSPTGVYYYWRCTVHSEKCMAVGLRDDVLKEIVSYVMKTDSFDENLFSQTVDFILVKEQAMLEFHYKNGEVEEVLYGHPSVNSNLRWSRERKQTQSQLAKRMCKERERNG